jgi:hypothetical protein
MRKQLLSVVFIALFLMLISGCGREPNYAATLNITVMDYKTHDALPNVRVTIVKINQNRITDGNGKCSFENLSADTYKLKAELNEYKLDEPICPISIGETKDFIISLNKIQ